MKRYDAVYGGFGFDPANPRRPKFPEAPNLVFLADYARRHKSQTATKMLVGTLEQISQGGIRDHVGGGFHRYSTDRYWRVPHFEKMLYDNGQLASVFSQAYELAPRDDFRRAVDELATFVLGELADEGAPSMPPSTPKPMATRGAITSGIAPRRKSALRPTSSPSGRPSMG